MNKEDEHSLVCLICFIVVALILPAVWGCGTRFASVYPPVQA